MFGRPASKVSDGPRRRRGFLAPTLIPLLAAGVLLLLPEPLKAQCGGGGGGAGSKGKVAQPRSVYDREQDVTVVSVGPVGRGAEGVSVTASYECAGKKPCAPAVVQVVLTVPGRFARHEQDGEVEFRTDGESLRLARTWYQVTEQRGGGVLEVIVLALPARDFLQLARAKTAECVIGSDRTYLTREQRGALEGMARRIEKEMKG